jgi:hypothetical protein
MRVRASTVAPDPDMLFMPKVEISCWIFDAASAGAGRLAMGGTFPEAPVPPIRPGMEPVACEIRLLGSRGELVDPDGTRLDIPGIDIPEPDDPVAPGIELEGTHPASTHENRTRKGNQIHEGVFLPDIAITP